MVSLIPKSILYSESLSGLPGTPTKDCDSAQQGQGEADPNAGV